jgi:hypothetical protein
VGQDCGGDLVSSIRSNMKVGVHARSGCVCDAPQSAAHHRSVQLAIKGLLCAAQLAGRIPGDVTPSQCIAVAVRGWHST